MVMLKANIVALVAISGAVLIAGSAQADALITCSTPLTLTSNSTSNPGGKHDIVLNVAYIKSIKRIVSQQHALDHWAQPFLTARGFNYDNIDIVTMYSTVKEKQPGFLRKYLAREREISYSLLVAMHRYGAPAVGDLGDDMSTSALWLASRATNKKDLVSLSKIFSIECKARTIPCGIVPTVQDRAQFVTHGTQTYGTLPNVVIEPTVKSLAALNTRRREFRMPAVPAVCFKQIHGK